MDRTVCEHFHLPDDCEECDVLWAKSRAIHEAERRVIKEAKGMIRWGYTGRDPFPNLRHVVQALLKLEENK